MSDNTECSTLLEEMRSTSLENNDKQRATNKTDESSNASVSMDQNNRVQIPWVITIVITEKDLYGYFGVEDTTNLMLGWKQAILDITGKIMSGGPYVYDREECLEKVFSLKAAFEEMNKNLLNPVPICSVVVTRAEFDPPPSFLRELTQFAPSRTVALYFSPDATTHLNILEHNYPTYTSIAIPIKDKVAAFLDKRVFSCKEIAEGNRVLLRDVLVCVFQTSSEMVLQRHIKERKLLCKRGDIFICTPEKLEKYLIFSFSYAINFTTLYEQWNESDCTIYVSRLPEVVLTPATNKYYNASYFPRKKEMLGLLELSKNSLVIDPLAIPYCQGVESVNRGYENFVYDSDLPSLRAYKKTNSKAGFAFCDLDCVLERVVRLEKAVQNEEP